MSSNKPVENMDVDIDQPGASTSDKSPEKAAAGASGTSATNVMAGSATVPSVTVSLHPLVIMNISEHWTRIRAQAGVIKQGKMSTEPSA